LYHIVRGSKNKNTQARSYLANNAIASLPYLTIFLRKNERRSAIHNQILNMQSVAILTLLVGNAAAFAPTGSRSTTSALHMSEAAPVEIEAEVEVKPAYPTINGWTADPTKFCAGLPGALAPMGNFNPLGLAKGLPIQEIKCYRKAEVTHGRVAMLATVGYLVAEKFHPFFGGVIGGIASTHLTQVREVAPAFFVWLVLSITTAEIGRAKFGWNVPTDAIQKNQKLDYNGKMFLTKLNE
jgi:hypothetical protein